MVQTLSFLFLVGVGFAMFALPLVMRVLTSFVPPDLHYLPDGNELLGFIFLITIAFGLVFERRSSCGRWACSGSSVHDGCTGIAPTGSSGSGSWPTS